MLCLLLRPCNEVVETNQHDVNKVTEAMCHGMLEGGSSVFRPKGMTQYANVPHGVVNAIL